jgi:hypothetical protein
MRCNLLFLSVACLSKYISSKLIFILQSKVGIKFKLKENELSY